MGSGPKADGGPGEGDGVSEGVDVDVPETDGVNVGVTVGVTVTEDVPVEVKVEEGVGVLEVVVDGVGEELSLCNDGAAEADDNAEVEDVEVDVADGRADQDAEEELVAVDELVAVADGRIV